MPIFFSLMILIGLAFAWNRNDDVFYEGLLAGWRGVGTTLIAIGIVGLICLWLSPGHAQEHHPPALHEKFYSTWNMPDSPRTSCCHNDDCSPAPSRFVNNHWEAERNGIWIPTASRRLQRSLYRQALSLGPLCDPTNDERREARRIRDRRSSIGRP